MSRNLYYEDEVIEKKFNLFMMKRMISYAGQYKRNYLFILALLIASSLFSLLPVLVNKRIIDEVLPKNGIAQQDYGTKAVVFLLLWISLSMCYVIMNYITAKITNILGNDIICNLRKDLFHHLMELDFDYYDSRPTGKILVRVTNYTDEIANFFINDMSRVISNVFIMILSLVLICVVDIRLGILTLLLSIPISFLMWVLSKAVYYRVTLDRNKSSNRTAFLAECINGLDVIQAFNREELNEAIFEDLSKQYHKAFMRTTRFRELFFPMSHGVVRIAYSIVIYIAALFFITNHVGITLTIGTLALVTNYVQTLSNAVNVICQRLQNLTNITSNIERVFDILDSEPKIQNDAEAEPLVKSDALTKPGALKKIGGKIDFENVSFSYENGTSVLEQVNLSVKEGEMIALVGPTGAGKTTIVSLLSRFYDIKAGKITIDGTDIRKIDLVSLRENVGVMMQDTFLFHATVMENIRFAKPDASDLECIEAAKKASAHSFIERMEHGYETVISSQNSEISAGERQLISFARLMLADCKIVILDEATSNIDTETERQIQKVFQTILKGRTSFVIAHRLSTIKNADRILYVDEKGIREDGNHEELVRKKGLYWNYLQG